MGYGNWLHGEAVAAGMVMAARVSHGMGLIDAEDVERLTRLVVRAGLPVEAPDLGVASYMNAMGVDKKVEAGRIRFVLLRRIGEAFLTADVPAAALESVLAAA
jgi:3-dehydroquinate synthase